MCCRLTLLFCLIATLCNAQHDNPPKSLKILWEKTDVSGHVSRNGKWFSYIDWSTGDLFVKEITTGKAVKITNSPGDLSEYPVVSIFSRSGNRISYLWSSAWEIRVSSFPDTTTQSIIVDADLFDWSADDESLLIYKEGQLGFLKIADKTFKKIIGINEKPLNASVSPDGKFIVFTALGVDPTSLEIKIISTTGGEAVTFISGPGRHRSPVWSIDGKSILYISDREDGPKVWRKPLGEKNTQESGQVIAHLPDAYNVLLGADSSGTIYIGAGNRGDEDVYHGLINWQNNSVTGETKILSPSFRGTRRAVFSPSSGKIACVQKARGYVVYPGWQTPLVRDLISGTEKTYPTQLTLRDEPAWSQNERALYFIAPPERTMGEGGDLKWSFYQLDLTNGKYSLLGNAASKGLVRMAGATSNAIVYFINTLGKDNVASIFSLDLSSGSNDLLYQIKNNEIQDVALSPEGSRFAIAMNASDGSKGLYILQKREKTLTSLGTISPSLRPQLMWFSSGDAIITSGRINGKQAIWRIPIDGSSPQALNFSAANVSEVRLSPDGRRIVFTRINRLPSQVLALDNSF